MGFLLLFFIIINIINIIISSSSSSSSSIKYHKIIMTFAVEWALNNNYLSTIGLSINLKSRKFRETRVIFFPHKTIQITVTQQNRKLQQWKIN